MLIPSAFPFKSVISALLILSLIAPSLLVPQITFASLGGGEDGSGGFGEGEGPDGGGSGPSDDGGKSESDDGKDAAAAEAAAQAANDAAAKSIDAPQGVSVKGSDATDKSDPNNPTVDVEFSNGVTAVGVTPAAAQAMADAVAAGLSPQNDGKTPGFSPQATADAHANGTAPSANSVTGNTTGVTGTPQAVAHAEIDAAIGSKAATAAPTAPSTSVAPTNSIQGILSAAAAHPALMDQTPISLQSHTFSPVAVSMTTAVSQPTVTPTQSFNTANTTIDANSFSLGSFAPGLSSQPTDSTDYSDDTTTDPNEGRMGLATGRMAQIALDQSRQIAAMQATMNNPFAPATQAQVAALSAAQAELDALDAQIASMISPTVTNQAVAAIAQDKAQAVNSLADALSKTDDPDAANQMAKDIAATISTYNSLMDDAKNDPTAAQQSLDNAKAQAVMDVNTALGVTPAAVSPMGTLSAANSALSTDALSTAVADTLTDLGLNPATAVSVKDVAQTVMDIATLGLSTIAANVVDAVEYSSLANDVDDPDSKAALSSLSAQSINDAISATAQAVMSAGLGMGFMSAVSAGLSKGLGAAGMASSKSAPSTSVSAAPSTAGKSTAAAPSATGKAPAANAPTVSVTYNPVDNTVTVSPASKAAANTVEGKFSPTASIAKAADEAAAPTGKTGMTGTAGQLGKTADDTAPASSVAKSADEAAAPTGKTGMTGTAGQLGKTADDTAPSVPGVTADDSLVGPTAPTAPAASPAQSKALSQANTQAIAATLAPTATTQQAMALALSMTQALTAPATLGRATMDAMKSVAMAISRTADDLSPTNTVSISVRSADDVASKATAPTAQAPTASTPAPAATTQTVGITAVSVPTAAVPTAQTPTTPSVASVPSQTAPAATTPAAQSPTAQATTPAAPTAAAPTAQAPATAPTQATNPAQTAPAATTPVAQSPTAQATTPAAPTAAAPTAQAPAASRSPVSEAISSAVRGIANAFNQLFGVTPAASKPASTVNIANLEKTPATDDFLGVVPDDSRFLSFEDTTTAVRALLRDLENKIKDLEAAKTPATLNNVIPKYSPATENNPAQHAGTIAAEVAKDIPGFTAATPISVADLKGPTGAALAKGFAQAEEGISLPDAEADKGVAAYAALPSVPTTLKNGVYAPTNPADQVTLDNIRNGSPTTVADATPTVQAPTPVQQAVAAAEKAAAAMAENSPTTIAVKATAGLLDQLVNPAPTATNPSATAPAQAQPAQTQPAQAQTAPQATTPAPAAFEPIVMKNKGVRNKDLKPALIDQLTYAAEQTGLQFHVTSGGQDALGKGLARLGSTRHDDGGAADGYMVDPVTKRVMDARIPADQARMKAFLEAAVKAGATGIGAAEGYMGPHKVHIGGGSSLAWGVGGKSKVDKKTGIDPVPGWVRSAHANGIAAAKTFDLATYRAASPVPANVPIPMPAPRPDSTVAEPTTPAAPTPAVSTPPTQTVEDTNVPVPVSAPRSGTTVVEPTTPTVTTPPTQTVDDTNVPTPVPAPRPDTTVTQPTTPAAPTVTTPTPVVVPITIVSSPSSPATNAAVATTPSTPSQPASQTPTPNVVSPTTPGATTDSTSPDAPTTPGSNVGTPPDNLGTVGEGAAATPASTNPVARAGYAAYAAIAGILAAIANLFGDDGPESDDTTPDPSVTTPAAAPGTSPTTAPGVTPAGNTTAPAVTETPSTAQPTTGRPDNTPTVTSQPTYPDRNGPIYVDTDANAPVATSSGPMIVEVLIQVDGNTGDLYFDIAAVYDANGERTLDYEDATAVEPETVEEAYSDDENPRIVLDDQRLNVIYSDGTYAPVTINGVEYDLPANTEYVYTVEYYLDGELLSVTENVDAIPKGNFVSNIINALFADDDSYSISDVSSVTRALIDPDSEVPADEYYIYRVYLTDGDVRSTTIPRYTSHRFMSQRFAETGFTGSVLTLITASVEIPPPSTGRLVSGVVNTLKRVGLTALDLFRNDENDSNPIVTDLGSLLPSDDGVINMNDIKSVIVLLDVEAECPAIPGLTRPYLYEIVIAGTAIAGASSDQAFRAVRCGGGTKEDYVEQVAGHFETFDGVGELDRARLTEMIRFAAFKDLDMSRLVAGKSEDNTATSTPATVPETPEDDEEFVPNVTNEVVFEVKATGSQGQTLLDWSALNSIQVSTGVQLHFRWDGSAYQQCLAFLNDSGDYALTVSNRAMTKGDTESEGYDVREASTTYRVECGGQRNNEFGVDDRNIQVIIE